MGCFTFTVASERDIQLPCHSPVGRSFWERRAVAHVQIPSPRDQGGRTGPFSFNPVIIWVRVTARSPSRRVVGSGSGLQIGYGPGAGLGTTNSATGSDGPGPTRW